MRERPRGLPLMRQTWKELLFLHWPVDAAALRPHVPARLAIDTFDGAAWIAIVPFTIRGSRVTFAPSLPFFTNFHELNVRTYVHLDGAPGVWFFSLDAASLPAVLGARALYGLPYFEAAMSLRRDGDVVTYASARKRADARVDARWRIGAPLPESAPGSLEFFLTERLCLYAERRGTLVRARIAHRRWPLRRADVLELSSTALEGDGISPVSGAPLAHAADPIDVEIWGPKHV
jgi:uncharacterized protein YqjF (DUF2071 family)